ncbi:vitamin K epoxide reductase family protein [Varibaculum vaginae]|uniref:vitamin K epoxide reductase family protein n=1 Tax=Varibaculum vaginae TaxID=2364797 RepID=UPI001357F270|nr:vitamin K epoxide reductase family protein [Varibaculum vaginae]
MRDNQEGLLAGELAFNADPLSPPPAMRSGHIPCLSSAGIILFSLLGMVASWQLWRTEMFHRAQPDRGLGCSLNNVVDCRGAMESASGHLILGIPNSIFGMIAFGALSVMGIYLLFGGLIPKWGLWLFAIGTSGGLIAVVFFFTTSVFQLHSLCPYCFLTWVATIFLAWLSYALWVRAAARPTHPLKGIRRVLVGYWWLGAIFSVTLVVAVLFTVFGLEIFRL